MKYSAGFRDSVLKKVIPPQSRSIIKVAEESGISPITIRNWMLKLEVGSLKFGSGEVSPNERSSSEKLHLLLESKQVLEENRGAWLREKGLHDEHLSFYEQELVGLVKDKADESKKIIRDLKLENTKLQREINRKDKTLAELAALIVLKKKAEEIWGDSEEDSLANKNGK
jgi:transposase